MTSPKRNPGGRPATGETPSQSVRISDARWEAADHGARAVGSDRAKVINQLLAWFNREPGAKLPKRPPAPAND